MDIKKETTEFRQFIPCYLNLSTWKDPQWICSKQLLTFVESLDWLETKRKKGQFLPKSMQDKDYTSKIEYDLWNSKTINVTGVSRNLFEIQFMEKTVDFLKCLYIEKKLNGETRFE